MLKPQLDQALRGVTQAPVPPLAASKPQKTVLNGSVEAQGRVQEVFDLSKLNDLLEKARASCAAIFFTSSTCAPCKICYPVYDELAAEFGSKTTLIKVDINLARDIAAQYQVRATPTFMIFLNGSKIDEWAGADPAKLRGNIRLLVQMAHPPHPHSQLRLPTLQRKHKSVTYTKVPPLEKLLAKLEPSQSSHSSIQSLKSFIEAQNSSSTAASATVPNLHAISVFISSCNTSSSAKYPPFPLIDLLRLSLLDPRVSGFFAEEGPSTSIVLHLLIQASALSQTDIFSSTSVPSPYPFLLITTQTLANLFTTPLAARTLLANTNYRTPLFELLSNLLSAASSQNMRQEISLFSAATSLALNISTSIHNHRFNSSSSNSKPSPEPLDEPSQVEFLAFLLEALGRESERSEDLKKQGAVQGNWESAKILLLATGLLAYESPREGEVKDLLQAMEAKEMVKKLKDVEGLKEICSEVVQIVD